MINTHWMDATKIALCIRRGDFSCFDVVTQSLERITQLNPSLNAFVSVFHERATRLAKARDTELKAGFIRGPLHGVPIAIKDLFDIEGYRTGSGSLSFPEHIAHDTANAVKRLEAAGAIVVGKTQMVEFAFGGWGTNPLLGAPRNPYDITKEHLVAGGSSSGSAVAVASGMVPLALGTDTGGSVRIPAGFCGLFGHKSSVGLIGRGGLKSLSPTHDSIGALARSHRDIALSIKVLSGFDADDASTHHQPHNAITYPHSIPPKQHWSLATLKDPALDLLDDEVAAAFKTFMQKLASTYGKMDHCQLPINMLAMCEQAGLMMSAESYASLRAISDDPSLPMADAIRQRINKGKTIAAYELLDIYEQRNALQAEFNRTFAHYDLLIMPATPLLPPPVNSVDEQNMGPSIFGRYVNMLDLCAIAIPIAQSKAGLPIGVQVIARHFDEKTAIDFVTLLSEQGLTQFTQPNLAI